MQSKEARELEELLAWDEMEAAWFAAREARALKLGIAIAYARQVSLVEYLSDVLALEKERLDGLGKFFVEQID